MRLHLNVLSLLVICVTTGGQETLAQRKTRVVLVPREIGLIAVAYQPNCPLQFENAKLLAGIDGGGLQSYEIRNLGTKPVRAITIGTSSGNRWTWGVSAEGGPVMPGQLIPPWSKEEWVEVVPLTKELREKLELQGPMRAIVVLMVIRIEFTDGTVFDDEAVYNALRAYLEDLEFKLERLEYLEKKRK